MGFGDRTSHVRIVGRGVLSDFADGVRLGEGAFVTFDGMRRLVPGIEPNVALVRLRPGAGASGLLEDLDRGLGGSRIYRPAKPSDLADLERVGGLPFVVAGLVALMGLTTLVHALFTSVRRRRRELAILRALGFGPAQTSRTVAWQATTIAAIAVVIGLPVGITAGRWAWDAFANRLGVPSEPATPVLALLLLGAATLALANAVAIVPARLAARTRSATALRAE